MRLNLQCLERCLNRNILVKIYGKEVREIRGVLKRVEIAGCNGKAGKCEHYSITLGIAEEKSERMDERELKIEHMSEHQVLLFLKRQQFMHTSDKRMLVSVF